MNPQQFFVVPITHVDLAWKRGQDEMSEMLEIVVVRLLDALEHDPTFKYHLEQAAHFRTLQKRRPDLIARLQPFLQNGRLEFVGAMASTLETNLPNGECFVRNAQMGLEWVRKTWGIEVETGWLIDTFGINAQVPQLLRGFGMKQLMASRFGGAHIHDLFRARGLDDTELTIGGWCTYSSHMKPENVCVAFYKDWDGVDLVFQKADNLTGPGPFMVLPYTENEQLVSGRPNQIVAARNREREGQNWRIATPREFFAAVEDSGRELPVVSGDLNPEFTGCFSLRQPIRTRNRTVETRLLEAEKWAALAKISAAPLENAWWQLHYIQFHDVFTGSHPTSVFHELMAILDEIEAAANGVLQIAFAQLAPMKTANDFVAFNGLPWTRRDIIEVPLPPEMAGVSGVKAENGEILPFEVRDGMVRVEAEIPAVGSAGFSLQSGPATTSDWREVETAKLENESIRLDFDRINGLAKLVWKPTGAVLMENAGGWLALQSDTGNFQIENPNGAEVPASLGAIRLETLDSPLGQTVRLSGEFPAIRWMKAGSFLRYSAQWFLPQNRAEIRLELGIDWLGEAARVRLILPTSLDTATGIYEIPFGVVNRKPYSPRANAKGEWPAQRWVALESGGHGLALVNTGVAGVEVSGGALYTTLLRAPASTYAGMVIDDTSSQHGHHDYLFSLVPYAGNWADAGVVRLAQEFNNPVSTLAGVSSAGASLLQLEPATVVLSAIKSAQDGSGDIIVRVYETAGRATSARLNFPGARQIFECDLPENAGEELAARGGALDFAIAPFEIKSFRCRL